MKLKSVLLCLSALAATLWSCNNDDFMENGSPDNTIRLTVTLSSLNTGSLHESRANPLKENGVYNEDVIHDAILVIYSTSLRTGTPADGETPDAVYRVSCTNTGTTTAANTPIYRTQKVDAHLEARTYYVLAIANPDAALTADTFQNMTLVDLRQYVYTYPVCVAGANMKSYDRFVMCSDAERSFTITQSDIDNQSEVDISGGNPIIVERLAARIDIAFGAPDSNRRYLDAGNNTLTVNSSTGQPSGTVSKIELPVYDYQAYTKSNTLVLTGNKFTLKDIDVTGVNTNKMYLIQRNGDLIGNLFYGEAWITDSYGTYSNYTVRQPAGVTIDSEDHSLGALIKGDNNLYTNDGLCFYTLGYYREHTTGTSSTDVTAGKTTVQLKGDYYAFSSLDTKGGEYNDIAIKIIIRHCDPIGAVNAAGKMAYAVGRNTIYRLRIDKILADAERVYVVWYYDSNNNGEFEEYDEGTPFGSHIVNDNTVTTPND